MIEGICLGDVILDCGDGRRLRKFYEGLLGGEALELYGLPGLKTGGRLLLFAQEPDYVPPVWPEEEGRQQKQMHFDFQVPDLAAAVKQAESLGAVRAKAQFGGEDFVTLLDPAGHPFCLCAK